MSGGGFLRQMNETIKYNRDLLGKSKRKPFDQSNPQRKRSVKTKLRDNTEYTETDRRSIFHRLSIENRRLRRDKLLALFLSLAVLAVLFYLLQSVRF